METKDIEELVKIFRDASISELVVTVGDSTVRLRKPLPAPTDAGPPVQAQRIETTAPKPEPKIAETLVVQETWITAPMVGVFHSLDKAVAIGSPVKAGQVIGGIESMKLMNEVVSEYDGVIAEITVEDTMAVEFGQRLFRLDQG